MTDLTEPDRALAELWFIGDLIHRELTESLDALQATVDRWEPKPMPLHYRPTRGELQ